MKKTEVTPWAASQESLGCGEVEREEACGTIFLPCQKREIDLSSLFCASGSQGMGVPSG